MDKTGETVKTISRGLHTFTIRLESGVHRVRVKVKGMVPFFLDDKCASLEEAAAVVKAYIKAHGITIDDAYEKNPGKRGSPEEWSKAAAALLALQAGTKEQWLIALGLTTMPNMQGLKKAYKAAARKAHPDLGGSAEDMQRVTEAYKSLQLMIEG